MWKISSGDALVIYVITGFGNDLKPKRRQVNV